MGGDVESNSSIRYRISSTLATTAQLAAGWANRWLALNGVFMTVARMVFRYRPILNLSSTMQHLRWSADSSTTAPGFIFRLSSARRLAHSELILRLGIGLPAVEA